LSTAARRNDPCPCGSGKRYKDCHGALQPTFDASLEAQLREGDAERRRGDHKAAIATYEAALVSGRRHPALLNNLGLSLQALGKLEEAAARYREALALEPDFVPAHANLGDVLRMRHRFAEAAESYTRAARLNPNLAALWKQLGVCQQRLGALSAARASFERARQLAPDDAEALVDLASIDSAEQRYEQAGALAERALELRPDYADATNLLLYARQQTCDWRDWQRLVEERRASLARADVAATVPHNLFALPFTPSELLVAARKWAAQQFAGITPMTPSPPSLVDGKLRIAYIGPDFRTHPLANLLTEVIELHDRTRFEVFGYSYGPDDGSAARARFARAFDHFIDVRAESIEATARRIAGDRIAVLLDTSGYVIYSRSEIFALRPAPIQINCIGFPGTLGADCYDYIMSDRFVTPPDQQRNFVERFMVMPDCFFPGDSKRVTGPMPTRAQCGLPEVGFVFCCFNGSYKITPAMFEVWMRLLSVVPGSVLWLLESNPLASANLRREAAQRDVAPKRLLFAPRVPLAEHLARHTVADLFLDTLPYNAHTTANDALYAGLPLLTCAGETFASRVSGSQLLAIGLPELVTENLEAYEAMALRLAHEPDLLRDLRERLRINRDSSELFNTEGYTRVLERLLLLHAATASGSSQFMMK
jgi:predicted O-linked N-acetylglucosamine transferase (SPINDLY family)